MSNWLWLAAAAAALGIPEWWYRLRGKDRLQLHPLQRTPWQQDGERFSCEVPLINESPIYEATVMELVPSVQILGRGHAQVRVELAGDEREDGYFPATILSPGETRMIRVIVDVPGGMDGVKALVVTLSYQTFGRQQVRHQRLELILPGSFEGQGALTPRREGDTELVPVKTHLLTDQDDPAEVVARYIKPVAQPGDVVVFAESVVAITQRRYKRPDEIKTGFLAKRLCYLIPSKGSLSSSHGMQAAIDEVGTFRMLAGFLVGAVMKILGQSGWLYTVAGLQSELIDDVTGTMAPYDKYVVMGPRDPQGVVDRIKAQTGIDAAIADVNDLKRACILAASSGVDKSELKRHLLSNPHGNSAEQTPLVVVRRVPANELAVSR